MKNYIPHFIAEKYKENIKKGKFLATSMFIDISGFTKMTNDLMLYGKEGAEILSNIMNNIFDPVINSVYENDGFITVFAGDAFTAVFKENPIKSLYSASEILKILENNSIQKTRFGSFNLSIKIGLSAGCIEYGIIGLKDKLLTYYFKGEAIDGCAYAEHKCKPQEIIFNRKFYDYLNKKYESIDTKLNFNQLSDEYFKLNDLKADNKQNKIQFKYNLEDEIGKMFQPNELIDYKSSGEFRNVVNVFISFKYSSQLIDKILEGLINYKGYLNGLDFGDKGANVLLQFGVPLAYEKLRERAINFVLDLKEKLGKEKFDGLKIGITYGTIYAGIIGNEKRCTYTCVGSCVNLSARLMMKADFGTILVDKTVYDKIKTKYSFEPISDMKFKGFDENLTIYKFQNKKTHIVDNNNQQKLIGRDKEFQKLKELVQPIFNNQFAGIVYVDGNAGIGKSRLVNELKEVLKEKATWFYLPCEEVLRKSFNPLTYFFNQYFEQSEENNATENRVIFEKILDKLINQVQEIDENISKDLIRAKSFLGNLISLNWDNSLYGELDSKGRYENTLDGVKNFIKAHTLFKPLIIEFEDGHWIDSDTENFLEVLTKNVKNYPFVIISACRLSDNGNNFNFKLNDVNTERLNLQSLSQKGTEELIKSYLRDKEEIKLEIPVNTFNLIYGKSEGNPFYIEQIMQYLSENDLLDKNHHLSKSNELTIPSDIYGVIIARIDRLKNELKDVVKTASVLGREFAVQILTKMLQKLKLKENLSIYLISGEYEKLWSQINELKYLFKHALIREAVYEMQLKNSLRELHELAAESIEEIYHDNLKQHYSDLVYHYEKSEPEIGSKKFKKLLEYLEKAGDYTKEIYQNEKGIEFYGKLIKLLKNNKQLLHSIFIKRGDIFQLIGEWDTAFADYKYSLEIAEGLGEKLAILKAIGNMGLVYSFQSNYSKAMECFEKKLKISEELGFKEGISEVVGNMGSVYSDQGNYSKAMECYAKQLKISEELGNKKEISFAVGAMGVVYDDQGNYPKAIECYAKKLKISEELGDERGISIAVGNMGVVSFYQNEYPKAMEYYEKKLKISEKLGDKAGISAVIGNMGLVYSSQRNYSKAMEYYDKKLKISEELGDKKGISITVGNMGLVYSDQGNYSKAIECYKKAVENFEKLGDKQGVSIFVASMGSVYTDQGNYSKSIECYERALEIDYELNLKPLLPYHLLDKAKSLYKIKSYIKAKEINEKCCNAAKEVENNDHILKSNILKEKIDFKLSDNHQEKLKKLKNLKNMLKAEKEDENIANLNYELSIMNCELKLNNLEFKQRAIEIYKKLYEKTSEIEFKNRIEELERL